MLQMSDATKVWGPEMETLKVSQTSPAGIFHGGQQGAYDQLICIKDGVETMQAAPFFFKGPHYTTL